MEVIKKRKGRPATPYKVPLMVRISKEAAEKIANVENKSEFIDKLIMDNV